MQFCEHCGSLMHADADRMVCSNCGASETKAEDLTDAYTSTASQVEDDVIESDPDADFEGKPTADDVHCGECGNGTAWYTIKQTGSADEPPTRFFKCTECGYRWREYS